MYTYEKQVWSQYDEGKPYALNVIDGAVATTERLNHMEEGIEEANKPYTVGNVTPVESTEPAAVDIKDDKSIDFAIPTGKSAYQIAVDNGFKGTEAEWLASLKGEPGKDGANATVSGDGTVAVKGEKGDPGRDGQDGNDGADGKSAYDIAVENGFSGTVTEWLASLKGEKGDPGQNGNPGENGDPGQNGADGKSAYQVAVDNGFEGTEAEWLASLKGQKGDPGQNGNDGADALVPGKTVEIAAAAWTEADGGKVTAAITDETVAATSVVLVSIASASVSSAAFADVKPMAVVTDGSFSLIADITPTGAITINYVVINPNV